MKYIHLLRQATSGSSICKTDAFLCREWRELYPSESVQENYTAYILLFKGYKVRYY